MGGDDRALAFQMRQVLKDPGMAQDLRVRGYLRAQLFKPAVAAAQLSVREAQERLATLLVTPQAGDVDALRRKVEAANAGVAPARGGAMRPACSATTTASAASATRPTAATASRARPRLR